MTGIRDRPARCSAATRRSSRSCTSATSPTRRRVSADWRAYFDELRGDAARRRARAGRSSRSSSSPRAASVAGAMVDATHDAQAGARAAADQQVPHARHVPRRPRSAEAPGAAVHPRARPRAPTASPRPTWTPSSTSARSRPGRRGCACATSSARCKETYCAHDRRRVHVHLRHADEALRPGAPRADPLAPELHAGAAQAHPRAPDRRRNARALPAHQVRRPEALLGRGRRHA